MNTADKKVCAPNKVKAVDSLLKRAPKLRMRMLITTSKNRISKNRTTRMMRAKMMTRVTTRNPPQTWRSKTT